MNGVLYAIAQAICWAGTGIMLRSVSKHVDPFVINTYRPLFGLVVVIPMVLITGAVSQYALLTPMSLLYLLGSVAIGGVFGDALLLKSLDLIGVSRAFPISNCYPVATVLFSMLLLDTALTWQIVAGLVLVLVGVYLISRPRQTKGEPDDLAPGQLARGVVMAALSAVLWGISTVIMAKGLDSVGGPVATSVRIPAVAFLSLIIASGRGQLAGKKIHRKDMLAIALTGILGWGAAGTLYASAVKYAGPAKTAIIGASSPLYALPMSILFLGERPTRSSLIGTVLSVIGIMLVV